MKLKIPPEEFEHLRTNARFILLLRLSRYVNQAEFCLEAFPKVDGDPSVSERRQMFNSMLFSAGVLYEALGIIPQLSKNFRHFPSYKKGFEKLWKDKNTHFLKEQILPKLRNGIIFHVDQGPIEETLKSVEFDEYVFFAKEGDGKINDHLQLADDIALNFVLRDAKDDEHEKEVLKDLATRLYKLTAAYSQSAFELIGEYALRKQWILEPDGSD